MTDYYCETRYFDDDDEYYESLDEQLDNVAIEDFYITDEDIIICGGVKEAVAKMIELGDQDYENFVKSWKMVNGDPLEYKRENEERELFATFDMDRLHKGTGKNKSHEHYF